MATMNVSLPDDLRQYVDARVDTGAYQSSSEYVRELIRRDQDVEQFRLLMREGMESPVAGSLDREYFADLKGRLKAQAADQ